MKLKENLKHQIDQLNTKDLRMVKLVLDSLSENEGNIKKSSKYRNQEIVKTELNIVLEAVNEQIDSFNIITIGADIMEETGSLITRYGQYHGLRTLDALHIACWMLLKENDWYFVSSDKIQLAVMQELSANYIYV
ncbi:MAG: type II toxin-antitoxin system VapC family toxin [Balneolales bacterium]